MSNNDLNTKLTPRRLQILSAIGVKPVYTEHIASVIKLDSKHVHRHVNALVRSGLVRKRKTSPGAAQTSKGRRPRYQYSLTPRACELLNRSNGSNGLNGKTKAATAKSLPTPNVDAVDQLQQIIEAIRVLRTNRVSEVDLETGGFSVRFEPQAG